MDKEPQIAAQEPALDETSTNHKHCVQCGELKPLSHFLRRTGRRSGKSSRRGTCRACRKRSGSASEAGLELSGAAFAVSKPSVPMPEYPFAADESPAPVKIRIKRPMPAPPPKPEGPDASVLRLTRSGFIRMRGKTDKGRGWLQETDLETAVTLVREHAAVVVNPHTIRRLYSNKKFRRYILTRDRYTCHFCGEYGDTIDHILPRAKGGHTTPVNCVCACNECNQSKADRSIDEFIGD